VREGTFGGVEGPSQTRSRAARTRQPNRSSVPGSSEPSSVVPFVPYRREYEMSKHYHQMTMKP